MDVCLFTYSSLPSGKAVEIVIVTCVLCMNIFVKFVFLWFVCMFVDYNERQGSFSNELIPLCPDIHIQYILYLIFLYLI